MSATPGTVIVNPDHATKWYGGIRFDQVAAGIIGVIAVMSALLGVVHTFRSMESGRANLMASRLAADISSRIAIVSITDNLSYQVDEAVLLLDMRGTDQAIAAAAAGDPGAAAAGQAIHAAAQQLKAMLESTAATVADAPLDGYAIDMATTDDAKFGAIAIEQNRQVDLAELAGAHDRLAVLGLSLLALAGVLIGLAAVLREGRAGWIALRSAGGLVVLTVILALVAAF